MSTASILPISTRSPPTLDILDNRLRNISKSNQKAVDISASYAFKRGTIDSSIGANATYIPQSETRTTPNSVAIAQSNILGRSVDFRGNGYVGLTTGGFTIRHYVAQTIGVFVQLRRGPQGRFIERVVTHGRRT